MGEGTSKEGRNVLRGIMQGFDQGGNRHRQEGRGKRREAMVVAVLPDAGNPYLSKFYNDDWLRENGWEPDDWD